MTSEERVRGFLREHKRGAGAALILIAACMLAVPFVIVSASTSKWSVATFAVMRLTALLSFTLIFMNIFTGAMAPYFYAVFGPKNQSRIHLWTGVCGFSLALVHGAIVIIEKYYRSYSAVWVIGPIALALLVLTAWVAIDRRRLKNIWRAIHQINYVIFVAVFVKAVLIGTDFRSGDAASKATLAIFILYAVLATLALLLKLRRYQVKAAKKRPTGKS
jgi:hypothetical protein